MDDKMAVLEKAPWNIEGGLLVLNEWQDLETLLEITFDSSPFWVQIHDPPKKLMNSKQVWWCYGYHTRCMNPSE